MMENEVRNTKEIKDLETRIELIMEQWKCTPFLTRKDFYAKQIHELAFLKNNTKYCKILKMESTVDDFWVEQMFEQNKNNGYVARFYSDSSYAGLYCICYAGDSVSSLGVRFVRDKKFKKGNKKC